MSDYVNLHAGEGAKFFSATQERQLKITVGSVATVYYDDASTVSSGSNDGNLTVGQSATFTTGQWIIPSVNVQLIIEYLPESRVQDVIAADDLTVGDDATIADDLAVTGDATIGATLSVTGATNYKAQVTNTGGAYATPIVLTTAQSGRVILLNDAAGLDFTLPAIAAADVGTFFKFVTTVSCTSNNYRMTAATGDLLNGGIWMPDFDTANTGAYFAANGSSHLVCTMNGSTKGGKIGTTLTFTALSATGWYVDGTLIGDGSLATPFS